MLKWQYSPSWSTVSTPAISIKNHSWLYWKLTRRFENPHEGLSWVQGTLKSLLQHHSSKASILWSSAFFIVQFSHPYMTTWKTKGLYRPLSAMSLLFNMLSGFSIAFLPRSKCLSISWLQSPPAVILEPKKIKFATISTYPPSFCHEVMGLGAMMLVFWMLSFKPAFLFSFHPHQETL